MLAKLFTTGDGRIPFVQIALGIIIGAVGMLIYARFYKPKILFPESTSSTSTVAAPAPQPSISTKRQAQQPSDQRQRTALRSASEFESSAALVGAPVLLDLGTLHPGNQGGAPELPLPEMFDRRDDEEDEDDGSHDDDEDELDEEEIVVSRQSGLTELP